MKKNALKSMLVVLFVLICVAAASSSIIYYHLFFLPRLTKETKNQLTSCLVSTTDHVEELKRAACRSEEHDYPCALSDDANNIISRWQDDALMYCNRFLAKCAD